MNQFFSYIFLTVSVLTLSRRLSRGDHYFKRFLLFHFPIMGDYQLGYPTGLTSEVSINIVLHESVNLINIISAIF